MLGMACGEAGGRRVIILHHLPHFRSFPGDSVVKNLPANAGDASSIPGLGRPSGEGNGNPLQYCYLGTSMERGGLQSMVLQRVRHNLATEQQQQQHVLDTVLYK